jgi:hypothetical protein
LVECNLAKVKVEGSNPFICWKKSEKGRVVEWFMALVLKTIVFTTIPWVRIPPLLEEFFKVR